MKNTQFRLTTPMRIHHGVKKATNQTTVPCINSGPYYIRLNKWFQVSVGIQAILSTLNF